MRKRSLGVLFGIGSLFMLCCGSLPVRPPSTSLEQVREIKDRYTDQIGNTLVTAIREVGRPTLFEDCTIERPHEKGVEVFQGLALVYIHRRPGYELFSSLCAIDNIIVEQQVVFKENAEGSSVMDKSQVLNLSLLKGKKGEILTPTLKAMEEAPGPRVAI